jgi:hypothetical protein
MRCRMGRLVARLSLRKYVEADFDFQMGFGSAGEISKLLTFAIGPNSLNEPGAVLSPTGGKFWGHGRYIAKTNTKRHAANPARNRPPSGAFS